MRQFRLNWGYFGGATNKAPGSATTGSTNRSQSRRPQHSDSNYQIYVGDLDLTINKQQVMDHFRRHYNSVVDGKIIVDQATKMSKGYGFVQFSNYEESKRALAEMQGSLIKGKPIKVSQGVSRNITGHGAANGKHGTSNSINTSILNQVYGKSGILNNNSGSPKSNILGGLGVQFRSPDGLPQSMVPIATPGYMQGNQPTQSYQMSVNPSMYNHPLVGQHALLYGYQQHGMMTENDQSNVNRNMPIQQSYQTYMPGVPMNQQAWLIPTAVTVVG